MLECINCYLSRRFVSSAVSRSRRMHMLNVEHYRWRAGHAAASLVVTYTCRSQLAKRGTCPDIYDEYNSRTRTTRGAAAVARASRRYNFAFSVVTARFLWPHGRSDVVCSFRGHELIYASARLQELFFLNLSRIDLDRSSLCYRMGSARYVCAAYIAAQAPRTWALSKQEFHAQPITAGLLL